MTKNKKTEQLVASAYEHLHPSTSVEDGVLAELTLERDGARMTARLWMGVAAAALLGATLLLALAFRGGDASSPDLHVAGEGVALPVVQQPLAAIRKAKRSIQVRVTDTGQVTVRGDQKENAWRKVSLEGFTSYLQEFAAAYTSGLKWKQRKAKLAHVRIIMAVDKSVSWQHVQWLMQVCAEQSFGNIAFELMSADKKRFLFDASLPTDRGIGPIGDGIETVDGEMIEEEIEEEPEEEIVEEEIEVVDERPEEEPIVEEDPKEEMEEEIEVEEEIEEDLDKRLDGHNERPDADEPFRGPRKGDRIGIRRTKETLTLDLKIDVRWNKDRTAVVYRMMGRPAMTLKDVVKLVRDGKRAIKVMPATHRAEARGSPDVPFGAVAALVATLRAEGVNKVSFRGTQLPTQEQRLAPLLPKVKSSR